jgi:hypothetical protein
MKKYPNPKVCLCILTLIYIFRVASPLFNFNAANLSSRGFGRGDYAFTVNTPNSAVNPVRALKKVWINHEIHGINWFMESLILFISLLKLILPGAVIDKRKRINEFNTIKLHGSKYKGDICFRQM